MIWGESEFRVFYIHYILIILIANTDVCTLCKVYLYLYTDSTLPTKEKICLFVPQIQNTDVHSFHLSSLWITDIRKCNREIIHRTYLQYLSLFYVTYACFSSAINLTLNIIEREMHLLFFLQ